MTLPGSGEYRQMTKNLPIARWRLHVLHVSNMSNVPENLGKPVAWQIRDIPESIRDAVVEQARQEKVNVAELVTCPVVIPS
jgi:hypothetical protein